MEKNQKLLILLIILVVVLIPILIMIHEYRDNIWKDGPLSNEQVLKKSQVCHKQGMSIQFVYDEELNIYAVKCIDNVGRKKR